MEKVDTSQVDYLKSLESSRIEINKSQSNKNNKELIENQSNKDISNSSKDSKSMIALFAIKLKNTKKMRDDKNVIEEEVERLVELVEK